MKKLFLLGLTILFFDVQISFAQPYNENPPTNDDCSNPDVYGGFGSNCTKIFNGTTIGATATNDIDVFTCKVSDNTATVYYTFNAGVEEVEFNLLNGENINVAVLTNAYISSCDRSVEITGNCFTDIDASAMADPMGPDILFTNLTPQTGYIMAIWTNEGEATDFSFCLTRAPQYECGDSVCYSLKENYADCPQECPCISSINFYSYQTGFNTDVPEAVCPEIVNGIADPANPGLYIPFAIETGDIDLSNSMVSSTVGILFTSTKPPTALPDNLATNFLIYLFLTEEELATIVDVSLSFTSDLGACAANKSFEIADVIKPQTTDCGACDLEIIVDYNNAFCSSHSTVTLTFDVLNAIGPRVWLSQDENTTFNEGVDSLLDLTNSNLISLSTNDVSFSFYDEGKPNCAEQVTFYNSRFNCRRGICNTEDSIALICRLQPGISDLPVICNEDGTLNVPINIGIANGAVIFSPNNIVTGVGVESDPYMVGIDPNNCQPINLIVMDESDCEATPIVTINTPESIAGGIFASPANDDVWGVQIATELGVCGSDATVTGIAVILNDMDTAAGVLTDFCEPTPPVKPDATVCNQIESKIALIDRGQCNFTQKVENAQNCGAIGVVICDCPSELDWCIPYYGGFFPTPGALENEITIPAVFMSYTDCQEIKAEIDNGNEVEICIGAPAVVEDCIKDFTVDVCDDYLIAACDDGDCGTENDKATVDASGIEICNCAGTAIQCPEGEFFNNDLCMCEDEDNNLYFSPQTGEFNCEE